MQIYDFACKYLQSYGFGVTKSKQFIYAQTSFTRFFKSKENKYRMFQHSILGGFTNQVDSNYSLPKVYIYSILNNKMVHKGRRRKKFKNQYKYMFCECPQSHHNIIDGIIKNIDTKKNQGH